MTPAEQEVLKICRAGQKGGIWCMRELSPMNPKSKAGRCVVVDNARWDSPVIAQGADWDAVLTQLTVRP